MNTWTRKIAGNEEVRAKFLAQKREEGFSEQGALDAWATRCASIYKKRSANPKQTGQKA